LTRRQRYTTLRNTQLFREIEFRLLRVQPQQVGWQVSLIEGQPKLFQPADLPDYARQIGRNTGYIIHPEEILAENFVHLMMQTPDLPDPWIVQELRKRLMLSDG